VKNAKYIEVNKYISPPDYRLNWQLKHGKAWNTRPRHVLKLGETKTVRLN